MAIASLNCPPPIRRRVPVAPRDYALRDHAIELYEAGRSADAARATLGYLLPALEIPDLAERPLCFVQGSARVRVRIDGGELVISTVLAELRPESSGIAALRYCLSRLSATGQLFQPRLRGDVLSLEFRDQLGLLHPQKLVEVLQRLPTEADSTDGWMVEQFAVAMSDREPVAQLEADEFERAWVFWEGHWTAMQALLVESRRRRSVRFLNALGDLASDQVRYTLPLFGQVRAQLAEGAADFTDRNQDPNRRDAALARCVKDMRRITREQLAACVGHATHAINPLNEGTPSRLQALLDGEHMQSIAQLRSGGRPMEAALELLSDYVYLLSDHSWPAEIESGLQAGLAQASGKPWREAADLLWNHASALLRSHANAVAEPDENEADHFAASYQD